MSARFTFKCRNCASESNAPKFCYSCARNVCEMCMIEEEACCVHCAEIFPSPLSSPASRRNSEVGTPTGLLLSSPSFKWNANVQPFTPASLQMPVAPPVCNTSPKNDVKSTVPSKNESKKLLLSPAKDVKSAHRERTGPAWSDMEEEPVLTKGARSPTDSTLSTCCDDDSTDGSVESVADTNTTVMICNIPCRLSQNDIAEAIEAAGFGETYDFVYLPGRGRAQYSNIGYAFVNFLTIKDAEAFAVKFKDYQFPGTSSSKRCTVKPAHLQGFNAASAYKPRRNNRA